MNNAALRNFVTYKHVELKPEHFCHFMSLFLILMLSLYM